MQLPTIMWVVVMIVTELLFFDDVATGNLYSLSNSVGVYKDHVDKNGTGTFLMWHWR